MKLKIFLVRWLANTLAVLVAAQVVRGIEYDSYSSLLIAALVLGILNSFLRPVLMLLTLPLLLVTLGLFTLVINAVLLYCVGWLVKSFHVANFWAAFWGGLVISLVSWVVNPLFGIDKAKVEVRRSKHPPGNGPGAGPGGPVIDV